jgi:hypothetical protein
MFYRTSHQRDMCYWTTDQRGTIGTHTPAGFKAGRDPVVNTRQHALHPTRGFTPDKLLHTRQDAQLNSQPTSCRGLGEPYQRLGVGEIISAMAGVHGSVAPAHGHQGFRWGFQGSNGGCYWSPTLHTMTHAVSQYLHYHTTEAITGPPRYISGVQPVMPGVQFSLGPWNPAGKTLHG